MVLAKPDTTQYQIMRIMNVKKWNYVRVVNLSDIRCANSGFVVKVTLQTDITDKINTLQTK